MPMKYLVYLANVREHVRRVKFIMWRLDTDDSPVDRHTLDRELCA